jgi:prenyltransferase beta subunit
MMKLKHVLVLFLTLVILSSSVSALTIEVTGGYRGEPVSVTLDQKAFIIFRMNNGTPVYAYGTEAKFLPYVTGELRIEAIANGVRSVKIIQITEKPEEKAGGAEGIKQGAYYLPSESRTALGALLKASELRGFGVELSGSYVRGIGGIYEKSMGETSGWMYSVNGEIPMLPASDYELKPEDTLLWYFVRNYGDGPSTSPYKIEIKVYSDWSFDIQITPPMPWGIEGEKEKVEVTPKITPTPEIKKVALLNATENSRKFLVLQNTSIEVNFTEIPLKLNLSISPPVEVTIKKEKVSGIIFNNLYATPLEFFNLELNKSGKIVLNFSISKEKLFELNASPHDVSLLKFNEKWVRIPVELSGENETHYFFQAEIKNFSLFVIAVEWKNFPLERTDEAIVKALGWLRSIQREDGGFANPGEKSSSLSGTSWAIMAISSAGEDPRLWKKNGNSPLDYLRRNVHKELDQMGTIDYARTILALVSAKENPRNFEGIDFVELLKSKVKEDGQIGDYVHTTIWGILALASVEEDVSKSVEWLKNHQNDDGGFSWIQGGESDFDDTAAAIQALIAGGEPRDSEVIRKALDYLREGQREDGGVSYFNELSSNSASDAWTIQALVAAGANPMEWKRNNISVVEHLLGLQEEDGHFKYNKDYDSNPGYMTVSAIISLLGKPHPIKPEFTVSTSSEQSQEEIQKTPEVSKTPEMTETVREELMEEEKKAPGFEVTLAILTILVITLIMMRKKGG